MDFKEAKINWQDILKWSSSWIVYTFKDWRKVLTTDNSENIDWVHGRNVSPTYARVRVITLEWVSDRIWNPLEEQSSIEYLQKIFALQWALSSLEEKELYIRDLYDNEWILNVKIKEPLDIVEWDDSFVWSYWKWRVVLESTKEPIYKSLNEILNSSLEWNYGWFNLGFKLWNSFNEIDNIIECNTTWNIDTPARIEITVNWDINKPLMIRDLTKKTFFWLDIDAVAWDKIVIDSEFYTVTKNWENILSNRLPWSMWVRILETTKLLIEDKDGNIPFNDFEINIYFRNSLL